MKYGWDTTGKIFDGRNTFWVSWTWVWITSGGLEGNDRQAKIHGESPRFAILLGLLTRVDRLRVPLDVHVCDPPPVPVVVCPDRSTLLPRFPTLHVNRPLISLA